MQLIHTLVFDAEHLAQFDVVLQWRQSPPDKAYPNAQISHTPFVQELPVTGIQDEVVESRLYPPRHEVHLDISVELQVAQGDWQF